MLLFKGRRLPGGRGEGRRGKGGLFTLWKIVLHLLVEKRKGKREGHWVQKKEGGE